MNLKKFNPTRLDIILENVRFKIIDIDKGEFEQSFPRHMHPFYELHYITGGKGFLVLDGEEYSLSEGDVFITAPKVYHAQLTDSADYMKEYHMAFEISESTKSVFDNIFNIFADTGFHIGKDTYGVGTLFELLEKENDSRERGFLSAMNSIAGLILLNTFRNFMPRKEASSESRVVADNRQLVLDEAFLYSYKDITLDDLAARLHLDVRQTQRIIKQKYGMNFVDMRTHMRLSAAQNMIRAGERTLSEISEMCGFANYAHFINVFKKKFGVSPSKYKKSILGHKE